jgi:vitamin B12 transporter
MRLFAYSPIRLFALFASAVSAQTPDTARIATVVVTATRVPIASADAPASVSVITGEELRRRGVTSVAEALRGVPGAVFAQTGSFGATTSLFLRGGESKYVKVLVDGVPVNDPGGAYDFGALTVDNVERIEVVRGPASVLYGADAVTGVIQIFTKRGRGPVRGTLSARGGTYGSSDVDAGASGGFSSGDFSLALARHATRGIYAFNSGFADNVLSGGVQLALDDRTDLRASLRYTDFAFHYPTNGGGAVVDSNAMRTQDQTTVGIELGRRVTPRVDARLSLDANNTAGGTDDQQDTKASSGFQSLDRIRRRGADLRTNVAAVRSTFTFGGQVEQQDQRSENQSVFGTSFSSTSIFHASRTNRALYAQALSQITPRVTTTVGARLDDNERFGSFETYRAAASWRALASTRVRASVGTAFREPSFFENYATGFVTGNPDLHPEHTATWEIGMQQDLLDGRVTVGATNFAQRFRDIIDYTGSTKTCGASYCNVARASANGRELEARATLIHEVRVDANLTHLETRVLDPGFDTTSGGLYHRGEQLIRRPTTTWNAGATYAAEHATLDVRLSHIGQRSDRDFRPFPAKPVTMPAYTRTDVAAELPLPRATALTLRIENLFDADYQSVFNFLSPRRTILAGARATF